MAKNFFNRYVWLLSLVQRYGYITLKEINYQWSRSSLNDEGTEMPERTFFHHRDAIQDMFGITIKCDRTKGYYIDNSDDVASDSIRNWMLQSLSLSNVLKESKEMHNRILCEEVPSSQKWLTPIIAAMKDECIIEMTYQSFNRDEPNTFEAEPYCVKMSQGRWYVLAKSVDYSEPRIYALDRILGLRQTTERFELPKDFNAEEYFSGSYGTFTYGKPEAVEIKVEAYQSKYLRSLPLHSSQQEVETTTDYSVFRYWIRPTYDFERALLSYGKTLEVIKPQSLRERIKAEIRDLLTLYESAR